MRSAVREATPYVTVAQGHDQGREEAGSVMDRLAGALGDL